MLFSSLTFLLYFLPLVILLHYVLPQRLQNTFLLLASLVFYAWGDTQQVPLFAILLLANWGCGRWIDATKGPKARRAVLTAGLTLDFGALVFYKYFAFLMENLGLESSFTESITLDDLAEHLNISKYHLSRSFPERIGCGLNAYINSLRADHAAMLLASTKISVTQVGFDSGFESSSTFFRTFKELYGTSPKQYRKEPKNYRRGG